MKSILIFAIVSLLFLSCSSKEKSENAEQAQKTESAKSEPQQSMPSAAPSHASPQATPVEQTAQPSGGGAKGSAAGIEWTVPATWSTQAPRPMRVVTYSIPAAAGDKEDGECGVFFFGSGQGGDVASNIERWKSQFELDSKPEESATTAGDLKVTTIKASGTYLSPGGPMMQSQGKKPNYRLHGFIVEAPDGSVFFKATGPSNTITAADEDIKKLIASIKKLPI